MSGNVLVGTGDGIHAIGADRSHDPSDAPITAITVAPEGIWSIADHARLRYQPAREPAAAGAVIVDKRLHCVLVAGEWILVGASEATILVASLSGAEVAVEGPDPGFADAPDRERWYTPWGGPPDVRSMARDVDGTVYANVHVGGILRRREDRWEPTLDIDADVHQVVAHPDRPGVVLAATAYGLAFSVDGASTWEFVTEGLHAGYCRAVAVSGDSVYLSASTGPRGERAAVYRSHAIGDGFTPCRSGLPEWFTTNVNTGCLVAHGDEVWIGDSAGRLYLSEDRGAAWDTIADDLAGIECLALR